MPRKQINIYEWKDTGRNRKGVRIRGRFPERNVVLDAFPDGIKNYAEALREQIAGNLKLGRAPDGRSLGWLDSDARERRNQLAKQHARGGAADPRYTDDAFRKKVDRNWDRARRFPSTPFVSRPRGHFSGHLASSLDVATGRGDLEFFVTQPYNRSLSRVLKGRNVWNSRASESERITEALEETLKLIQKTKKRR